MIVSWAQVIGQFGDRDLWRLPWTKVIARESIQTKTTKGDSRASHTHSLIHTHTHTQAEPAGEGEAHTTRSRSHVTKHNLGKP